MTDTSETTEPEVKPRLRTLGFVAAKGDFTIVCGDDRWRAGEQNANGALNAFLVHKEQLTKHSLVFKDMFELNSDSADGPDSGQARIKIDDKGHIVASVLSAAWEPSRETLSRRTWEDLNLALHLAIKWRMDHARTGIFFAMQARLLCLTVASLANEDKWVLVNFFVEAVRMGKGATTSLVEVLRLKKSSLGLGIKMVPLDFTEIHFLEIGAAGCSEIARIIIKLVKEGVLLSD